MKDRDLKKRRDRMRDSREGGGGVEKMGGGWDVNEAKKGGKRVWRKDREA